MAATTYLELVNVLRDKFNEVHLTETNWTTVVGFDQYTKDAINYAYGDVLDAEMEWPFLHVKSSIQTVPGTQFYAVTTNNASVIKEIDWDSFFIAPNTIVNQISAEPATIGSTAIVSPAQLASWNADLGVIVATSGVPFAPVDRDPIQGQYTIKNGSYYFNSADIGVGILLTYRTSTLSTININPASFIYYMDYDAWRQNRLQADLNDISTGSFSTPRWVIRTQVQGEIGFSPVPDKIYVINFEHWVDSGDLLNTTDVPVLPQRFLKVILDGAASYCYDFREDPQMAASYQKKFDAGISRMRTELINRQSTMRSGMYWRKSGPVSVLITG